MSEDASKELFSYSNGAEKRKFNFTPLKKLGLCNSRCLKPKPPTFCARHFYFLPSQLQRCVAYFRHHFKMEKGESNEEKR